MSEATPPYGIKDKYNPSDPKSIEEHARKMIGRTLRDIMDDEKASIVKEQIQRYGRSRKGFLGNLVEENVFGITANSLSEPDFPKAGVELKTSPLKRHVRNKYCSKERLVFSMIDYENIGNEKWEESSFLKKNGMLLLMFYLFESDIDIIDYEFKLVDMLKLLDDLSAVDVSQIKQDWEFIVNKVKKGKAHELSEGDTFYLGACTKGSTSSVRRRYSASSIPAKPRAFSLKQTYLNHVIQKLLKKKEEYESIAPRVLPSGGLEQVILSKFQKYIGKTDAELEKVLKVEYKNRPKDYRRRLVARMFGVKTNKIQELEKANVTLKVICLEQSGKLTESISFPYFDYCKLYDERWEESEFFELLDSKKFLFVIFQKDKNKNCVFKKAMFWNFPARDMDEARRVWEKAVKKIKENKLDELPKISESGVAHVRPHGRNSSDTTRTPQGGEAIKRSFWLNAKYIQEKLG